MNEAWYAAELRQLIGQNERVMTILRTVRRNPARVTRKVAANLRSSAFICVLLAAKGVLITGGFGMHLLSA